MALQWVEETNIRGPQGPQGDPGPTGPTGSQGPQGVPGSTGGTGPQGPAGIGFDPAPSVATYGDLPTDDPEGTTRLVVGPTVSDAGPGGHIFAREGGAWTDLGRVVYEGPQGPAGADGPQGVQGDTGPQGTQGPKGDTGTQGVQGPQGATGPQGTTGSTGEQGPAGAQGGQGVQGPAGTDGARGSLWYSHTIGEDPTKVGRQVGDHSLSPDGQVLRLADI